MYLRIFLQRFAVSLRISLSLRKDSTGTSNLRSFLRNSIKVASSSKLTIGIVSTSSRILPIKESRNVEFLSSSLSYAASTAFFALSTMDNLAVLILSCNPASMFFLISLASLFDISTRKSDESEIGVKL